MSVNKVILLGRLGKDPELKSLPNGNSVCNFSIATSEKWNDKASGQKQEKTEWHNITVYGKIAESCSAYLAKGREVFIEGKIQTRSWDDKDGNKRYTTEVIANNVQFIGSNLEKNEALKTAHGNSNDTQINTNADFASDDIPF